MSEAAARALLRGLCARDVPVRAHALDRPVLAPGQLLLPPAVLQDPGLRRAAVAHAAAHLRHSPPARAVGRRKALVLAVAGTLEDARVEALLAREYPGTRRWFAPCLPPASHGLALADLLGRLARVLCDPRLDDPSAWVGKGARLFHALSDLRDAEAVWRMALVLANDLGQMRVPFVPGADAVAAYRDDHSLLWDHGRDQPQQPLPQDAEAAASLDEGGSGAAEGRTHTEAAVRATVHPYAEWDARLGRRRKDWCTVLDHGGSPPGPPRPPSPGRGTVRLAQAPAGLQEDGDDIDLAAALRARVDRARGLAGDTRWYRRRARAPASAGLVLLLDLSRSTAQALPGEAHTVLDAEKQTALALVRHLRARGVRVAVHGFWSDTRAAVHYERLLFFDAALDAGACAAVQAAAARGSTRLGAALRHAATLLQGERLARRGVLLLSDGAPQDVDVFDPEHLVQDARAAVHELARAGVRAGCGALEPAAARRLRTIFGHAPCTARGPGALPRLLRYCEGTLIA